MWIYQRKTMHAHILTIIKNTTQKNMIDTQSATVY